MINQIICGDCMTLMKDMSDNSVEMTLTDIPYGVVNRKSAGIRSFDKTNADVETFCLDDFVNQVVRVTNGSIYVFCSTEQVSFLRAKMVELGLTTRLCIWRKNNPSPVNGQYLWLSGIECCVFSRKKGAIFNEHCKNPVWEYPTPRKKHHPTEKPLALFEYLIKVSSGEGDIIFDPCVGGGTTALAAAKTGRKYIAFDLDQRYISITLGRVRSYEYQHNTKI